MADSWQTIEQAAVSLRLSVRTVNRHMVAGKLESRLNTEGRREVLVSLPDAPIAETNGSPFSETLASDIPPLASDTATATSSTVDAPPAPLQTSSPFSQAPSPAASFDPETVLALADNAAQKADMAVTAYQTLARLADTQVRQVRRQARCAWAAVAVMATGITGAVGWATHNLTRATADREYLSTEVQQLKRQVSDSVETVRQQSASVETALAAKDTSQQALRTELTTAREHAARAEGSLAAYKEQEQARQTREAFTALSPIALTLHSPVLTLETVLGKTPDAPTSAIPIFTGAPTTAPVSDASDTSPSSRKPSIKQDSTPDIDSARLASATSSDKPDEAKPVEPTTAPTTVPAEVVLPTTAPAAASDKPSDAKPALTEGID